MHTKTGNFIIIIIIKDYNIMGKSSSYNAVGFSRSSTASSTSLMTTILIFRTLAEVALRTAWPRVCSSQQTEPTTAQLSTLTKQGIHRHQTPPQYCNPSPCGPLWPNMMSSIKPEVHNVLQRRQRRTKPWPHGMRTKNFVKIGPAVPEKCSWTDRQTDRQTSWSQYSTPRLRRSNISTTF